MQKGKNTYPLHFDIKVILMSLLTLISTLEEIFWGEKKQVFNELNPFFI